jgi:hypothetical protein
MQVSPRLFEVASFQGFEYSSSFHRISKALARSDAARTKVEPVAPVFPCGLGDCKSVRK